MLKASLLILFASFIFAGDGEIILKKTPKKENAVTLSNSVILKSTEGFYERTISAVAPNNTILVFDVGNKLMHVYNLNGSLKTSFGKQGEGPGEFSQNPWMGISRIIPTEKYIVTQQMMKLMFFTYEGELVREIKTMIVNGHVSVEAESVKITYPRHKFYKTLSTELDFTGKEINTIPNPVYNATEASQMFTEAKFLDRLQMPFLITPYNKGFVQFFTGEYKFQYFTEDYSVLNTYTRPFNRLKELKDPFEDAKKNANGNKQLAAMFTNMAKQYAGFSNGFQGDIQAITGTLKNFLIVQTASESLKTLSFDVISQNGELYTTFSVQGDETFDVQQGSNPVIQNGKLVINYNNDEDGPYVKLYDLTIN